MIHSSNIQYFYDPDEVSRIVDPYPHLKSRVKTYQREEVSATNRSKNFPDARKSYREIYRILGAQHYQYLQDLLPALERCLANDFEPVGLFKPAASEFHSSLSVIFAAYFFLARGYAVKCCDIGREQERIFDFVAGDPDDNFLVEVYSPRSWEGWFDFNEELRLALLHLDCPYDFSYVVNMALHEPDFEHGIFHFDPWDFSEAMETPERRFATIKRIRESVLDKLVTDASPFTFDTYVTGKRTTTRINVKVDHITHGVGRVPNRLGYGLNSLSGYAPQGMFDRVLQRKVVGKKLQRGQLPNERPKDGTRALLVDLTRLTFFTEESQYPTYRESFLDSIERHLLKRIRAEQELDLIIFAKMSLQPRFIFCCAYGADAENEIAAFVGRNRQVQVLRRRGEFIIAGETV